MSNNTFNVGYLAGAVISACVNTHTAQKSRQLQESISKEQLRQQKDLAMEQRELQKDISREQMELQREISENSCRLQAAIAEKNLQQQMELSHESRELQKQLALFNAAAQRETALLNTKTGTETNFNVNNFPLYIRSSSYDNAAEDVTRKVKIVFSPPSINTPEGGNGYAGSDIIMTSWMTRFLQENIPDNLYEYLGSAWRDDRFRAQSAYRSIFNEFSNQPFIILDCDILRNSFNFRVCFWAPGSEDYRVQQIITDFKTNDLLLESARNRARIWHREVYEPLTESGMTVKELRALFPQEINNEVCLEKEQQLQKIVRHCTINQYSFMTEDYDYCMQMISQLNAIAVGMFLDMYHMTIGNTSCPVMLKRLSGLIDKFPDSPQCNMKQQIAEWIIKEYMDFAEQLEGFQKESTHLFTLSGNPVAAQINCRIGIIGVLLQLSREKEARQLLEDTNKKWCEYMLGIEKTQLFSELGKKEFFDFVVQLMLRDKELTREMNDLSKLNDEMRLGNFEPVKRLLTTYQEELLVMD